MILEPLENADRYAPLHPAFPAAFEFLRRRDLPLLAPGRHELDGGRLYVLIEKKPGRGKDAARLESHRRYIDIQYTLAGNEVIGHRPTCTCTRVTEPYNPERDIEFFGDAPEIWVTLPPGRFTILYPDDAHAPLAGEGDVHKAVVKVLLEN
ncbi:MAG: YhcH/YjgK/YiaL family protein [Candidatus Sumerlaeia bacterium]|nr:YhcH/YjgK/YiaL family protein [Candidatus Sumerlaeia bacterium]